MSASEEIPESELTIFLPLLRYLSEKACVTEAIVDGANLNRLNLPSRSDQEQNSMIDAIFDMFDLDGDGFLNLEDEFTLMLRRNMQSSARFFADIHVRYVLINMIHRQLFWIDDIAACEVREAQLRAQGVLDENRIREAQASILRSAKDLVEQTEVALERIASIAPFTLEEMDGDGDGRISKQDLLQYYFSAPAADNVGDDGSSDQLPLDEDLFDDWSIKAYVQSVESRIGGSNENQEEEELDRKFEWFECNDKLADMARLKKRLSKEMDRTLRVLAATPPPQPVRDAEGRELVGQELVEYFRQNNPLADALQQIDVCTVLVSDLMAKLCAS